LVNYITFSNVLFTFSESSSKLENNQQTEYQLSKINGSAFKCCFCSKGFSAKQDWSKHMQSSHPDNWFQCSVCDKQFMFKEALKKHKREEHKQKVHSCQVCPHQLDSYEQWKSHMQGSHKDVLEKEWFHCVECKTYFGKKKYLSAHQSACRETVDKKFKCGLCSKTFTNKHNLILHKQKQHPENGTSIECALCQIQFFTIRDLTEHAAKLHKPTYKSCHICSTYFSTTKSYIKHMHKDHYETVEKEWCLCDECKIYFPDEQYLLRHAAVAHKSGEKCFKCNFCSDAFTTKQRHSEHMKRIHSDMVSNEWNECSECKKLFPTQQGLRHHIIFTHQMPSTKKIDSEADVEISHFPSSQIKDVPIEKISSFDNEEMQMETNGKSRYVTSFL
jgi:hypothetical protein